MKFKNSSEGIPTLNENTHSNQRLQKRLCIENQETPEIVGKDNNIAVYSSHIVFSTDKKKIRLAREEASKADIIQEENEHKKTLSSNNHETDNQKPSILKTTNNKIGKLKVMLVSAFSDILKDGLINHHDLEKIRTEELLLDKDEREQLIEELGCGATTSKKGVKYYNYDPLKKILKLGQYGGFLVSQGGSEMISSPGKIKGDRSWILFPGGSLHLTKPGTYSQDEGIYGDKYIGGSIIFAHKEEVKNIEQ